MTVGIYLLKFKNSPDKVYIGQSIDIEGRVNHHRYLLELNKHYNYKLQEQYNISEKHVEYEILEANVHVDELNELEIHYIEHFNSLINGFNINSGGTSGGKGINNSNSKYSKELIIECFFKLLDYTISPKKLAKELGMSESSVSHISGLRQHLWLKDIYPEEYKILEKIHSEHLRGSYQKKKIKVYPPIINPEGLVYYIDHLTNFCKEHRLHAGALSRVLAGTLKSYLGWKLV